MRKRRIIVVVAVVVVVAAAAAAAAAAVGVFQEFNFLWFTRATNTTLPLLLLIMRQWRFVELVRLVPVPVCARYRPVWQLVLSR